MSINITNKKFYTVLLLVFLYVLFLVPYSVVSSVEKEDIVKNGIVISSQTIPYQSLPKGINDILPLKEAYNLIIIKDVSSPEKSAVIFQGDQYSPDDFIKVEAITTDMYIDYHTLSTVNKPFNKLIIGEVNKVEYGGDLIEYLAAEKLTFLISISKAVFYIGGFLIIIIISLIFTGTLKLWNIPAVLSSYSLQFFIINMLSVLNQGDIIASRLIPSIVDILIVPFGYLFIVFVPLTMITKKYEDTDKSEQIVSKFYHYLIRAMEPFSPAFKK